LCCEQLVGILGVNNGSTLMNRVGYASVKWENNKKKLRIETLQAEGTATILIAHIQ